MVAGTVARQLIKQVQRPSGRVIVHPVPRPRVRIPPPVHSVCNAVKFLRLSIRDGTNLQVLKYLRSGADYLAQILMSVPGRIGVLQVLGIGNETRAEPFRRRGQVGAVMDQLAGLFFQHIAVGPVASHSRRIEALKRKAKRAATQGGLLHIADLLRPIKLIQFFEPVNADISKRHFDGFHLAGIIHAEEHDLLSGGNVGTFHGAHRTAKLPR